MSRLSQIDDFQRRHPVIGLPLAVFYKFFDDQGPYLAAVISYYAFAAIFPVLLISTSILGFVLQGDPELRHRLLNTALSQFPIVGDQLGSEEGLRGSTSAVVVGSLVALYGSLGLGTAAQNAANVAWAVPRNSRANPFLMRLRSLLFLAIAGFGILVLAIATTVLANPDAFGGAIGPVIRWVVRGIGFVLTTLIFVSLFRLVSIGRASVRELLPGAVVTTIGWQLLQLAGNTYVTNLIGRASQTVNQTFALVLGLMAFLFLSAIVVVFGLEVNVVLRRRLFPRALLTPFTDRVSLTRADKAAYTMYAQAQRHKGFQEIEARFAPPPRKKSAEEGTDDVEGDEPPGPVATTPAPVEPDTETDRPADRAVARPGAD